MTRASSLWRRIFLATALVAMLGVAVALTLVNRRITDDADRAIERAIATTAAHADQLRAERTGALTVMAHVIADQPRLRTGIGSKDPAIVKELAGAYQSEMKASLVLVTNRSGDVLFAAGTTPRAAAIAAHQPAVRDALAGRDSVSLLPQPTGILQIVTVPIAGDPPRREPIGTLGLGFLLDERLAADLKTTSGSDVAFGMDGQILAATVPRDSFAELAGKLRTSGFSRVQIGGDELVVLPRRLSTSKDPEPITSGAVALILRSRSDALRSLRSIQTGLAATGIAALLATGLSVVRTFR